MNALKFTIVFVIITVIVFFVPVVEITIVCITTPCEQPKITIREYLEQKLYPIGGMMDDIINPEPVLCISLYAPVCGMNDITYSNQCFAEVAGVTIKSAGVCTP